MKIHYSVTCIVQNAVSRIFLITLIYEFTRYNHLRPKNRLYLNNRNSNCQNNIKYIIYEKKNPEPEFQSDQ